MKKIASVIIMVLILASLVGTVFATEQENSILKQEQTSEILKLKEETGTQLEEYTQKYGSSSYGLTAFILNKVRLYSIPFCFIGIAIGAICEYAIGTRRLDMKQKGFNLIITFVTLLVICQVLPLIFTIVVIGWRG